MGCRDMFDQVCRSHEPAHSPSCGIEVLASRANGDCKSLNFRRQGRNSSEGHVEKTVVDLVGENDYLVSDTDIANLLELLLRVDLAHRVVYVL